MGKAAACCACAKPLTSDTDGIEVFGSTFCSMCFIGHATSFRRELKPEDIELLKLIGREAAGLLPASLLEMILVGFYRNGTGRQDSPPREETMRAVGEVQRLAAFSVFAQTLKLLKTWQDMFNEFVDTQHAEIQVKIKKLTDFE